MSFLEIIRSLLVALTYYLRLKNLTFYYDILEKSQDRQSVLRKQIETLRNTNTNESNARADVLFNLFLEEKRRSEHISAYYSEFGKGGINTD